MHKTWLHMMVLNFLFVGILAKLHAAIKNSIPVGYQDETGFHFGVKDGQEDF